MGFFSEILNGISQSRRYEDFKKFREGAMAGNPLAQFHLAECYEYGSGVEKDEIEAVKWFSKSAEQKNAKANYKLGCFYKDGQGVQQDYQKAYDYFWKIVFIYSYDYLSPIEKQMDEELECCYIKEDKYSEGARKKISIKETQRIAEQGNTRAQLMMGRICESSKKDVEAAKWFQMAVGQVQILAQFTLGYCYYKCLRDDINFYYSSSHNNYWEAVKWFRMAAEQGDPAAMLYLGMCYENGDGVEGDLSEAVKWYKKANSSSNPEIRKKATTKLKELQ